MKRTGILIFILLAANLCMAQLSNKISTAKSYVNNYIINNGTNQITGVKLNNAFQKTFDCLTNIDTALKITVGDTIGVNLIGSARFRTQDSSLYIFNGSYWRNITAGSNFWTATGSHIYNNNTGNVAIGGNSPNNLLSIGTDGNTGGLSIGDADFHSQVITDNGMHVKGNVGIGTNTPTNKLEVVGNTKTSTLQVTTGAAAAKVLTSDASGNATWQTPSAGGTTIDTTSLSNRINFANINSVNVKQFGAKGDTTTDNTAAFQAALNSFGTGKSGTVYVPEGAYKIAGQISIPVNVRLIGTWRSILSHSQNYASYWGSTYDQLISGGVPTGGGSILLITGNAGSSTATATFTLATNSYMAGFCMYWPNQVGPSSSAPIAYPYAIKGNRGNNITVENIELLNAWQGVYFEQVHRGLIKNISGQVLKLGIFCDGGGDVNRIEDVQFGAWISYFLDGSNNQLGIFMEYNGTSFQIGREDNIKLLNCFSFGYNIGYRFMASSTFTTNLNANPWVEMDQCSADGGNINIQVEAAHTAGIIIRGGQFSALGGYPSVVTTSTFTGRLKISDAYFYNISAGRYASLDGSGNVDFNNCWFAHNSTPIDMTTTTDTAIYVTGTGAVQVSSCFFNNSQKQLVLGSTLKLANFTNNTIVGLLNVTNNMTSGYIINNNTTTATYVGGNVVGFPTTAEYVYDTFSDTILNLTAHTADVGGGYTKIWGNPANLLTTGFGKIYFSGGGTTEGDYALATQFTGANQTASIRLAATSASSAQSADVLGVYVRANISASGKTGYEGRFFRNTGGNLLQLVLWNNGTPTVLYSAATTAFTTNTYNILSVNASGSTITLKLNGSTVYTQTETTLAGGATQRSLLISAYTASGYSEILADAITGDNF